MHEKLMLSASESDIESGLTAFLKCYCFSAQIEKIRIICFWLYVVGM
ncbi:hypothetical protein GXM_09658 [Nostoc sphaeroides CCNUC1]|uniref:Uncharacterized protein n=1 Tax=Nostoc sphaeroides CCNUC1 TaxID=2653204 RepID=A0A5P8WCW1_9NOSO|nr:hypothetical protein GXM_08082 [Nostoc sphaeroides CCNUC1]QFS52164.1 hypothetical protein GXM_09658 [Nostoc sphaeroides CCNUC1]